MQPKIFFDKLAPFVLSSVMGTGVPASLTMAQAAIESNWGESGLTTKGNNLFGVKGRGDNGSGMYMTTEYIGGKPVRVEAAFAHYTSWKGSIDAHTKLLLKSRYKKVLHTDYKSAALEIRLAGYATDPTYTTKLINMIQTYGLDKYDREVKDMENDATIADWKTAIMDEAKSKGLITSDHNPDDDAPKWFVLQTILNALKKG